MGSLRTIGLFPLVRAAFDDPDFLVATERCMVVEEMEEEKKRVVEDKLKRRKRQTDQDAGTRIRL